MLRIGGGHKHQLMHRPWLPTFGVIKRSAGGGGSAVCVVFYACKLYNAESTRDREFWTISHRSVRRIDKLDSEGGDRVHLIWILLRVVPLALGTTATGLLDHGKKKRTVSVPKYIFLSVRYAQLFHQVYLPGQALPGKPCTDFLFFLTPSDMILGPNNNLKFLFKVL